jgi:DNA-binding PadR family transcriptional regulator
MSGVARSIDGSRQQIAAVRHLGTGTRHHIHPPDPTLLVLLSLAGGEKHGYAIMLDIRGMSCVRVGPGTVYGALHRLEECGLIEATEVAGRCRYRLTDAGAGTLSIRLATMRRFVDIGRERIAARLSSASQCHS